MKYDRDSIESLSPWFYEFDLGSAGRTTSKLSANVRRIHETRLRMVTEAVLANLTAKEIARARCLDVGCHEGFYAVEMAKLGFHRVVGIDAREESLRKARFVARALRERRLTFRRLNAECVSPASIGTYDVTLFLGLLYHVENPMLCLRNLSSVTQRLSVIETQVIDEVEGEVEWGSELWKHRYRGVLALIDEDAEFRTGNTEVGATPLGLCPSPNALRTMLEHAGFRDVVFLEPPSDAYEQLARKKRIVCVARK